MLQVLGQEAQPVLLVGVGRQRFGVALSKMVCSSSKSASLTLRLTFSSERSFWP